MKYSMIFFPLIGAVIGLLEWGLFELVKCLALPRLFFVLIGAAIPLVVTGGIHVDGYMDSMDAFNSYGDREKKLAIMKDPHTGAFAVIHLVVYGLIYLAFLYIVDEKGIILFCMSFAMARIFSGISVVTIKGAKDDGMLHELKAHSAERTVLVSLIIMFAVCTLLVIFNNIISGCVTGLVLVVMYFLYRRKCMNLLDGITGDTSGYYLCMMELVTVIIAAIVSIVA